MRLLLKKGRVISPGIKDGEYDILIENGRIKRIDKGISEKKGRVINLRGLLTFPGFIDIHTHLRDPGWEYKEDIESGSKAGAWGGFTAIACMANTNPVNDNPSVTRYIREKAKEVAVIKVLPVGAVTKGLKGEELSEMGGMYKEGAVAFSDDGNYITNSTVMRRALEYSGIFDLPIISHPEDTTLSGEGVVNEGISSLISGMKGIPPESEEIAVFRDATLCALTKRRLHLTHISTKGSVEIIRSFKKKNVRVTCDVTPHHLFFTEKEVFRFDPNFKMKPPLRSEEDRDALFKGLADGTIDMIATDHAPHDKATKEVEFNFAPFGVIGLQTALPVVLHLWREGVIKLQDIPVKCSLNPARLLGLKDWGVIKENAVASITVVNPDVEWVFTEDLILSKSSNSPFLGMKLKGRAVLTISEGRISYYDEKI
jgi:dihydroorotase